MLRIATVLAAVLSLVPPIAARESQTDDDWRSANLAIREHRSEDAVALLTRVLRADAQHPQAYYLRGRENFKLGHLAAAVEDFDRQIEITPDIAPRQWERGIALFYAGRYERGARQFESYQTFDARDVENSVWRFLCLAKTEGVAKARATMLPIEKDPRVPMMQIFEMFRGTLEPEDVLKAARASDPPPEVLAGRLFYAHLYLGLFFDALGDSAQAKKYILLAADEELAKNPRINRYMWDVARLHKQQLEESPAKPERR